MSQNSSLITPNLDGIPPLKSLDPELCYLDWCIVVRTERQLSEIEDVFLFVADSGSIKITDISNAHPHIDELADKRLGELLVDEGHVQECDIAHALQQQKRIGEVLVEQRYGPGKYGRTYTRSAKECQADAARFIDSR